MVKLNNLLMTSIVFGVLVVLIVSFWSGFRDSYHITDEENLKDGKTIFEKLRDLNLIEGTNKLKTGVEKLTSIGSSDFDILGGLASSAVGVLQTIGGIVSFPIEIFGIITGYYEGIIPEVFVDLLGLIVIISVATLLISAKLGFDFR